MFTKKSAWFKPVAAAVLSLSLVSSSCKAETGSCKASSEEGIL